MQRVVELAFQLASGAAQESHLGRQGQRAGIIAVVAAGRDDALARSTATSTLEHMLVDTASMRLITSPAAFDVLVTENMFGDILTDEASVLAGSMGMLPSASLGSGGPGLYEPIHGSAPDIAGKGIANPIGTILSAALLLRYSLKLEQEAQSIEKAVDAVITDGCRTADLGGSFKTHADGG